ncbi:hypothetical protein Dsin_030806 [Dipteronia sinensis]|uniref:Uncharacterized protein n=1 Tax=Dipteronia sinensis TaxID=43782 RepID=A0AAD9ZKC0_9ROSI|nr:hypothetical protein Dsin_030806 [Dipteronia sinensis]
MDLLFSFHGDTALLTVNDDEFWEGVSPVEFGGLPALQDAVTVVGYPIGGDTILVATKPVITSFAPIAMIYNDSLRRLIAAVVPILFMMSCLVFPKLVI